MALQGVLAKGALRLVMPYRRVSARISHSSSVRSCNAREGFYWRALDGPASSGWRPTKL